MANRNIEKYKFLVEHRQDLCLKIRDFIKSVNNTDNKMVCWRWPLHHHKTGYAVYSYKFQDLAKTRTTVIQISRFLAYLLFNRFDQHTRHLCNQKWCVNPFHLMPGTPQQNQFDSPRKNKSSKYMGVFWYKQSNKWRAQIHINGKNKYLGFFTDEISAAKAYDAAALKHFGPTASFNF